ncbi:unnamed protein product, partial [Pocillopora meandrina]
DANNVNVSEVFRSAKSMISVSQSAGVLRRLEAEERKESLRTASHQKLSQTIEPFAGSSHKKPNNSARPTKLSRPMVKKMAGQGLLYVRIKPGFEFVYGEDRDSNHGLETSLLEEAEENNTVSISCALSPVNTINPEDGNDLKPHHEGLGEHDTQSVTGSHRANDLLDNETDDLLLEIDKQSLSDPVEILRFLQQQLIKG